MSPRRRTDEELLHLLLEHEPGTEPERTAELLAASEDPEEARILDEHRALLARARTTFDRRDEWSASRERGLVRRILSSTTRQDLRWRGDLALVGRFVRQRLATSPALRALAATVVLGMFVSSLFAWLAIREPEPKGINILIDHSRAVGDLLPETEADEASEEAALPEIGDLTDAERRAWEIDNAFRRDRYLLAAGTIPAEIPATTAGDPLTLRLLEARARRLAGGEFAEELATEATLEAAVGLDRVLLAELLLDRLVLDEERTPILARVLQRIARGIEGGDFDGAVLVLAQRVLDRARAYGAREAGANERITPGPRPLAPEWAEALAAAVDPSLRAHPLVALWRK